MRPDKVHCQEHGEITPTVRLVPLHRRPRPAQLVQLTCPVDGEGLLAHPGWDTEAAIR